jgi:uncharacterized protein (TIGR01777 family)
MKILVTGATGLIGQTLVNELTLSNANTNDVVVLSRQKERAQSMFSQPVTVITQLDDIDFNELDVVINLAGEAIADKRWRSSQKNEICHSRWLLTQQLSDAINAADTPPHTFISGSAIGYYGRQNEQAINETFNDCHQEFTYQVCQLWEQIALQSQSQNTRVCLLRTGIVLAPNGGALSKMLPAFKLGLGGPIASGQQFMSWIHLDDMVAVILACIDNKKLFGAVNATSPNAVNNEQFSQTLSKELNRPCVFRVPAFVLKLLLGELSDLLLYGQNVYPEKLLQQGFIFKYPTIDRALNQILLAK